VLLLACFAAAVAGAGVALAAAGPSAAPAVICPLEPNSTVTTCCGPPVVTASSTVPCCRYAARAAAIPCCGPLTVARASAIACPVLELTISSSPDPSTAGRLVTISGRWAGATSGATVVLWQKLPGSKVFKDVAHATSSSSGQYQFARSGVETNREWYVTVSGVRSLTIEQRVRAVVTLASSATGFSGRVTPDHGGERVLFESEAANSWIVIARPRLTRASSYSWGPVRRGVFRTVVPRDRRNIRSVSPVVVLHG
jgi:hypothetical protein